MWCTYVQERKHQLSMFSKVTSEVNNSQFFGDMKNKQVNFLTWPDYHLAKEVWKILLSCVTESKGKKINFEQNAKICGYGGFHICGRWNIHIFRQTDCKSKRWTVNSMQQNLTTNALFSDLCSGSNSFVQM